MADHRRARRRPLFSKTEPAPQEPGGTFSPGAPAPPPCDGTACEISEANPAITIAAAWPDLPDGPLETDPRCSVQWGDGPVTHPTAEIVHATAMAISRAAAIAEAMAQMARDGASGDAIAMWAGDVVNAPPELGGPRFHGDPHLTVTALPVASTERKLGVVLIEREGAPGPGSLTPGGAADLARAWHTQAALAEWNVSMIEALRDVARLDDRTIHAAMTYAAMLRADPEMVRAQRQGYEDARQAAVWPVDGEGPDGPADGP